MTGKIVTQPNKHIHTNVQNNMNPCLHNCQMAEFVKYANGKNAVKPPNQPGIHNNHTNPKNIVNIQTERISNNMRSMDVNMRVAIVLVLFSFSTILPVKSCNPLNTLFKMKPPS